MDHQDPIDGDNFTFDRELAPKDIRPSIAHEIVFVVFSIVAFFADFAIIYTIFRFRRMRTVANIFLANWAIADTCSLLVTPSSYKIISVVQDMTTSAEFLCVLFETGSNLHVAVIVFVLLVLCDWIIDAYFPQISDKFRSFNESAIASIWIGTIMFCAVTTGLCIQDIFYYTPEILLLCTFGTLLLSVIVLQCVRLVQKCRKRPLHYRTLPLTLVTAFTLSYVLAFLNITVMHDLMRVHNPFLAILSACFIFCSPIVNFTLLYYFDKNFQACFLQAIQCKVRYDESISEIDSPTNNARSTDYAVQVSFHNPTEELLTNAY